MRAARVQTIEVLACTLAHRAAAPARAKSLAARVRALPKQECICCTACGTRAADPNDPIQHTHKGTWVECSGCAAWMHARCLRLDERNVPATLLCAGCMRDLCLQEVDGTAGATLIVCPEAIQKQWLDEIERHTAPGALRVVTYAGQKASLLSSAEGARPRAPFRLQPVPSTPLVGLLHSRQQATRGHARAGMPVTAADLAAADVVLTTFDVLRKDVAFEMGAPSGRSSRASKYPVFPTPLTRLTWWRAVVDEAQMIEGATSKAAQMTSSLRMVNRWCVTGTPLSRGLDDIHGLLRFLKVHLPPPRVRRWSVSLAAAVRAVNDLRRGIAACLHRGSGHLRSRGCAA